MAFLGKLKSVFGFSSEEYEIEENELSQRDATVTPLSQRRQTPDSPAATASATSHDSIQGSGDIDAQAPDNMTPQKNCPEAIFKKVVEIFNDSLPAFLRESIDPEKQAKYIHDALDNSMKEYIDRLGIDADIRMKAKLENGQSSLRRELEILREKTKKIEDSSVEWKEQKLSAERQKRALSERVHDLEKQIDSFHAEKEQYELENKSLVNKLRAMSIQDGDLEALRNENEALCSELKAIKEHTVQPIAPAVDQETIRLLESLKDKVEDLTAQKETLLRERSILANDIVVLKKKCEISDAMLNDLNHKASSAKLALAEKESKYNDLQAKFDALSANATAYTDLEQQLHQASALALQRKEELASMHENLESAHLELQRVTSELHNESVKVQQLTDELRIAKETIGNTEASDDKEAIISARDTEIKQLKEALTKSQSELQTARDEVEESRSSLAAFEQSLVKIDEINEARQNRITELQQQLKEKENALESTVRQLTESASEIKSREDEIAVLKTTIENNMQLQAASEALLREEIERLRKSPETVTRQKRKKAPQISSIDESLDDTNWLVSTPPAGTNARPGGVSDAEFGYQAPQHRDEPNNPAQMLLW